METPPLPLSDRLREAVRPIHERIERLPFFAALSARTLPLERYVDQLRAMAIVEATLDRTLLSTRHPAVAAARDGSPRPAAPGSRSAGTAPGPAPPQAPDNPPTPATAATGRRPAPARP